jgi:exodeoxyribonuclease VII small subunit
MKDSEHHESANAENFEATLKQLQATVEQMEHGQLTLEQSLQAFEDGVKLARQAQTALTAAEQRVRLLTEQDGTTLISDFRSGDESDA